jgi:hypothetical protein
MFVFGHTSSENTSKTCFCTLKALLAHTFVFVRDVEEKLYTNFEVNGARDGMYGCKVGLASEVLRTKNCI